jgi:hypothetical protein
MKHTALVAKALPFNTYNSHVYTNRKHHLWALATVLVPRSVILLTQQARHNHSLVWNYFRGWSALNPYWHWTGLITCCISAKVSFGAALTVI